MTGKIQTAFRKDKVMSRGFVSTTLGQVHYRSTSRDFSSSVTLLCFHMSPRSVDEFKEIQSLSLEKFPCVVAVDIPGYGASDNPVRSCTIDDIAKAGIEVCDVLGIQRFYAVGSLLGCMICISIAKNNKNRVLGLVLSNFYHWPQNCVINAKSCEDEAAEWQVSKDGSHLIRFWDARSHWLSPDLNNRVVLDEFNFHIKQNESIAQGIKVQDPSTFDLTEYAQHIQCPVVIIVGTQARDMFDKIGFNMSTQLETAKKALRTASVVDIAGGSINMLNQNPEEWSEHVENFIQKNECSLDV